MTQAQSTATAIAKPPAKPAPLTPEQRQQQRAAINLGKFLLLAAQLGGILALIWGLNVQDVRFQRLATFCFAGFIVHYFAPFRFKKTLFILISLAGGFFVLATPEGTVSSGWRAMAFPLGCVLFALGMGLVFYIILRNRAPFWLRLTAILVIAAALAVGRHYVVLPNEYWQVLGAAFMFRLIVYIYDVRTAKGPEKLSDFMAYFYTLPVFYFVLFPVVDYTTFKKSYYVDDIHKTAQRGVNWIMRGVVHLCLYRLIYHNVLITAADVTSFPMVLRYVFPAFWLYLQVSGWFHIIVGMLHLFGYKLPETNHKYFLASSFADFWRRINIYWKDFMVKVFYYPAYFRLRKKNETMALLLATAFVFVVTTFLHSYQLFWIKNDFKLTKSDPWFWGLLGVLVMFTVWWEAKHPKKRVKKEEENQIAKFVRTALSTLLVYVTISVLWSMWSSQDPAGWVETLMYWR